MAGLEPAQHNYIETSIRIQRFVEIPPPFSGCIYQFCYIAMLPSLPAVKTGFHSLHVLKREPLFWYRIVLTQTNRHFSGDQRYPTSHPASTGYLNDSPLTGLEPAISASYADVHRRTLWHIGAVEWIRTTANICFRFAD